MRSTSQIAKQLREVFFGGNWTSSNLKENLSNVTWEQATTKVSSLNTIAALVFHINYYVVVVSKVLREGILDGHDKLSFDHPPILSEDDWQKLVATSFVNAENLASLIEQLPDEKLWEDVTEKEYQNYYRHLFGIVEHTHYHLGQIVLIKKLLDGASNHRL